MMMPMVKILPPGVMIITVTTALITAGIHRALTVLCLNPAENRFIMTPLGSPAPPHVTPHPELLRPY